jgi:hypothetical protein
MAICIIIGAQASSRLLPKLGVRPLLLVGTAAHERGLRLALADSDHSHYWDHVFGPGCIISLAIGVLFTPLASAATSGVHYTEAGLASGVLNTARQMGGSVGLAVLATIAIDRTRSLLGSAHGTSTAAALTSGYGRAFALDAILGLCAFAAAFIVPSLGPRPSAESPAESPAEQIAAAVVDVKRRRTLFSTRRRRPAPSAPSRPDPMSSGTPTPTNGQNAAPRTSPDSAALVARLGDVTSRRGISRSLLHLALTPTMRRIRCTAPGLADLSYRPGQDLMLAVPAAGASFRRRYTIRSFDPAAPSVDIDVVLHGDGPAAAWAASVQPGGRIEAIGPRGKVTVDADADWHLFAGDDSAVPASLAMAESLPDPDRALVVLEVDGPDDQQQASTADGREIRCTGCTGPGPIRRRLRTWSPRSRPSTSPAAMGTPTWPGSSAWWRRCGPRCSGAD